QSIRSLRKETGAMPRFATGFLQALNVRMAACHAACQLNPSKRISRLPCLTPSGLGVSRNSNAVNRLQLCVLLWLIAFAQHTPRAWAAPDADSIQLWSLKRHVISVATEAIGLETEQD